MRKQEGEYLETRVYKFRDIATVVSSLSAIIMALGMVGKFYVDSYRLTQLERIVEAQGTTIFALQRQVNEHLVLSEGRTKELGILNTRVDACCPLNRR